MRKSIVLTGLVGAAILAVTCAGCRGGRRTVNVVGSTSIQPFAEELAEDFYHVQSEVKVIVQGGGSTAGLQALENGMADIGTCSRDLGAEEQKKFTAIVIARDGVAVVVNNRNTLDGLTRRQVRDLFAGRIANWKAMGGSDHVVSLVTREEGSGTRESFVHLVMEGQDITPGALTQPTNGAVRAQVAGDPGAIGFMSLGQVDKELKALAIDGVKAAHEEILAGRYPLVRPFLFVVKGQASPDARKFIDYVLSAEGQKKLEQVGLVRAK
jgi:phosphate transport system substrate-binding protein